MPYYSFIPKQIPNPNSLLTKTIIPPSPSSFFHRLGCPNMKNSLTNIITHFILFITTITSLFDPSTQSKVSLSITPAILAKLGDPIWIQRFGISSPSKLDWLGIYNPPNSPHVNFIGYVFFSSSATWQSRSGSISIPLINLRSSYSFWIFQWVESEVDPKRHDHDHNPLQGTTHLLKKSMEVGFELGCGPEQIHLGFSKNEHWLSVLWSNWSPTNGQASNVTIHLIINFKIIKLKRKL